MIGLSGFPLAAPKVGKRKERLPMLPGLLLGTNRTQRRPYGQIPFDCHPNLLFVGLLGTRRDTG